MLTGVALPLSQSLLDLIVPHNIGPRVHARDGKLELQFLFRHAERVLPFLQDGQLRIARWGNRRGERSPALLWLDVANVRRGRQVGALRRRRDCRSRVVGAGQGHLVSD